MAKYEIYSDMDILYCFLSKVLKYREKIKCSVCQNVLKDPMRLPCSHTFCAECIFVQQAKQKYVSVCPHCHQNVDQKNLHKIATFDRLINYVENVDKKLYSKLGYHLKELATDDDIRKVVEKRLQQKSDQLCARITKMLHSTVQSTATKKLPKEVENTSTNKQRQPGISVKNKSKSSNPSKLDNEKSVEKSDADCGPNQSKISSWLNDSTNAFDRTKQTQQSDVSVKDTQNSFNLPSVSQIKNKDAVIEYKQKTSQNKGGHVKRKLKSLDVQIKKRTRRKRHISDNDESELNVIVEKSIDDEDNLQLMHLMEEEVLKNYFQEQTVSAQNAPKESANSKAQNISGSCKINNLDHSSAADCLPKETDTRKTFALNVVESYFKENMCAIPHNKSLADDLDYPTQKWFCNGAVPDKERDKTINAFEDDNDLLTMPTQRLNTHDEVVIKKMIDDCIHHNENVLHSITTYYAKDQIVYDKYKSLFYEYLDKLELAAKNTKQVLQSAECLFRPEVGTNDKPLNESLPSVHQKKSSTEKCNAFVQTEFVPCLNNCTQTDNVYDKTPEVRSIHVQTDQTDAAVETNINLSSQKLSRKSLKAKKICRKHSSINILSSSLGVEKNSFESKDEKINQQDPEVILIEDEEQSQILNSNMSSNGRIWSEKKQNASRKLDFSESKSQKKKFKRIRAPSSDDSDLEDQPKKPCNKYLHEDLSIKFVSEVVDPVEKTATPEENSLHLSASDGINYGDLLSKVMQKYGNNSFHESQEMVDPQWRKDKKSQQNESNLQKYDLLIEQAEQNQKQIHQKESFKNKNNLDSNVQTARVFTKQVSSDNVFSSDEVFNNQNLEAIERVIKENNKAQTVSKVVTDQKKQTPEKCQSPEKAYNIFSDSLFINTNELHGNNNQQKNCKKDKINYPLSVSLFTNTETHMKSFNPETRGDNHTNTNETVNKVVEDFNSKLNDSFDDDIAFLDTNGEVKCVSKALINNAKEENNKIKILQNIGIPREHCDIVPSKGHDHLTSESDEEIFSDADVIDTTPVKCATSNVMNATVLQVPDPKEKVTSNGWNHDEEDFAELILPPPPEFQSQVVDFQCADATEQKDCDVTNIDVREMTMMTPDITQANTKPDSNTNNNLTLIGTSTPISGKTKIKTGLSLSPISALDNRKALSAIDLAKSSRFSPLTVTVKTPLVEKKSVINTPKQQQSILNYVQQPSQESKSNVNITLTNKKPCVSGSRLTKEQVMAISALANKKIVSYSNNFNTSVTHLVVDVNEDNCVKDHTIKYISGVAAGIWVVNSKWVQECLRQNCLTSEEPFEVFDISGVEGPKRSRLTRVKNPLLKGYKIYVAPPLVSTSKTELENVVTMLGGKIVTDPIHLLDIKSDICLIISEASITQELDSYEALSETFKVATVDIEWLTRSVGQYEVLSLSSYNLCSDELLHKLGYPPQLLGATLTSLSTQNTDNS